MTKPSNTSHSKRANDYNSNRLETGAITWGDLTTTIRYYQSCNGLDVDGMLGPATLAAIRREMSGQSGDQDGETVDWTPGLERPRNRAGVIQRFGNPGREDPDPKWVRDSIVECHPRGDVPSLPGAPESRWVKLHHLVEPIYREGLRRAQAAVPGYRIERIGGYVFRHQRHDPSRPLSYHSWGIALDIDPHKNGAKTISDRNGGIQPWSEEWNRIWPKGLPREWVLAMESVGLVWGGRWKGFVDPMHFQFVG